MDIAIDPDDDDIGRIIIIGGWLGTGPLAASDMHVLDISHSGKQLRWYEPPVRGSPPGPCNMHSADYVAATHEVYVFRGGNGREYLNDLHALNTRTFTWRKVETTGAIPQQRANHSSSIIEETGELLVFGGWNGSERLNDIHILDTASSTWTCPHVAGVLPHPRAGMTLTALRGRLYLFGGSGTSSKCFQDLQILDRSELAWLDVTHHEPSNHSAGRHRYESFEGDGYREQRWSFGGYRLRETSGDAMDMDTSDANHQDHRLRMYDGRDLWDSTDNRESRYGGISASPNPNDEDTIPTIVIHGRGPGRRAGHTATAVNRKIFVFGGSCGSDYLNDFYVLDTDPPPRASVTEPASLALVERRLRHFFNDEEFSDVTFLVQGRKIYAHKMILSMVSNYFRTMFTSGFRETESGEVEIPDCSYDAFIAVVEYIYTGGLPNFGDTRIETSARLGRVVDILELSNRFCLNHLKEICETELQDAVNSDTVEYLLQVAQDSFSAQLQLICEHFLRNLESEES